MKIKYSLLLAIIIASCSSAEDVATNIEYELLSSKWYCENSGDLIYGDHWARFDQEYITLFFTSDSEGLVKYHRIRSDTDDGSNSKIEIYNFTYIVAGAQVKLTVETGETGSLRYHDALLDGGYGNCVFRAIPLSYEDRQWMSDNAQKKGICGPDTYWAYSQATRTLKFAGNGKIDDYSSGNQPWVNLDVSIVKFDDGITCIGNNLLRNFASVTDIIFPASLRSIGDYAFSGTTITSLNIPSGMKSVGKGSFSNCKYLKSIILPDSLERIGDAAFSDCPVSKTFFFLPDKLESIGDMAFSGWKINSVKFGNQLKSIGNAVFLVDGDVVIPDSVERIGQIAFAGTFNKVVIGKGVTSLSKGAFSSLAKSGSIYVNLGTPPVMTGNVFANEEESRWKLYVPKGAGKAYSQNGYWKKFKSIIEDSALSPGGGCASDDANTGVTSGHEWVDLGLPSGNKWATCNIGASSPEEFGEYFSWGVASPIKKNKVSWDDYELCDGDRESCKDIGDNISGTKYDTATASWGSRWRMPTDKDWKELYLECKEEITEINGVTGALFVGKSNGNSIFLPATARIDVGPVRTRGVCGFYWASTHDYSNEAYWAYVFNFFSTRRGCSCSYNDLSYRGDGCSIRGVTN